MMTEGGRPSVSVVIEGYNESLRLGSVADTMDGLARQDFPLDQVEVILIGSPTQVREWRTSYVNAAPFACVKVIAAEGAHYYALKNQGAHAASGDIIALTDSDARPEPRWLSSIVTALRRDADVTAGVTLFRGENGRGADHALMQVAASISWGFVLRSVSADGTVRPGGFLSHNVAFRAAMFQRHRYRTDLGRTCAGSFLYSDLVDAGARIVLQPEQRVAHTFTFWWWVLRLHRRFGYEVLLLRRLRAPGSRRWLEYLSAIEPMLTMLWHVALDIPQWWRVSRLLRLPLGRRVCLVPVLLGMSCLARGGEMVGMYQTMLAPRAMKRFAEAN